MDVILYIACVSVCVYLGSVSPMGRRPPNRGARSPPTPTLTPHGGKRHYKSWLTGLLTGWSYDTCQDNRKSHTAIVRVVLGTSMVCQSDTSWSIRLVVG